MRQDRGIRARREAAIDRAKQRSDMRLYCDASAELPDDGLQCGALASDGLGDPYALPFPVVWKGGQWLNGNNGTPIAVKIVKWRYA
jgi:hypothetical protein